MVAFCRASQAPVVEYALLGRTGAVSALRTPTLQPWFGQISIAGASKFLLLEMLPVFIDFMSTERTTPSCSPGSIHERGKNHTIILSHTELYSNIVPGRASHAILRTSSILCHVLLIF